MFLKRSSSSSTATYFLEVEAGIITYPAGGISPRRDGEIGDLEIGC
jgi:hypothetical protein